MNTTITPTPASSGPSAPAAQHTRQPYTPAQVLANLAEMDRQLAGYLPNLTDGPGWVRGIVRDILERGISPQDTACRSVTSAIVEYLKDNPDISFADVELGALIDEAVAVLTEKATEPASEIAQLRAALAHALAFIEHDHPNFDDPITEIDSFTSSSDGGPEMECNLKMMRDALAQ